MEPKNWLSFTHEQKTVKLKYHDSTTQTELATVIMYVKDMFKTLVGSKTNPFVINLIFIASVDFLLDGEPADAQVILDNLDREITVTSDDSATAPDDKKPLVVYINKKDQLIRISMKEINTEEVNRRMYQL